MQFESASATMSPSTAMAEKPDMDSLSGNASDAACLLKALSHQGRLMIMCSLADGDKSVSEIEAIMGWRQAAVSQQLARLREDKLVATRRQGKSVVYSLADERAKRLIMLLYEMFCAEETA